MAIVNDWRADRLLNRIKSLEKKEANRDNDTKILKISVSDLKDQRVACRKCGDGIDRWTMDVADRFMRTSSAHENLKMKIDSPEFLLELITKINEYQLTGFIRNDGK